VLGVDRGRTNRFGALFLELDKTGGAGGGYIHGAWRPARVCTGQVAF
jgi:hypothetical protein